ncbi:MAG: bifunctional 4-hydroxy-2-oxoglutarate aldolase/2-dehydro-3-deoxy-phosphogluconate aldolase [Ruminococcaceae bacterium]|nr:bifunctional 4-hydroxy-2-oxoglutarate aldolase/2-dehydro-3-deoxy-phosphogluconate aldolase [Oscillospiraceae bacterium]
MSTILQILNDRVIAILRGLQEEQILKTMEALREGGLNLVEITFDQRKEAEATAAMMKKACAEFGNSMCVGAGTVMTEEQLIAARDAGAQFILTPQTDIQMIRMAHEMGLVTIPGAFTPTEIAACHVAGADIVKVFPAGTVGPDYIKAVRGPMPHIRLSAVGGVNLENISDFFDAGVCSVGIGSNIVDNEAIRTGNYKKITELAAKYRKKAGSGASK